MVFRLVLQACRNDERTQERKDQHGAAQPATGRTPQGNSNFEPQTASRQKE